MSENVILNKTREAVIQTMIDTQKQLSEQQGIPYPSEERVLESPSFGENIWAFWGAMWHTLVASPLQRLEIERRSTGRQMGRHINTMRELSGQKPYGETE